MLKTVHQVEIQTLNNQAQSIAQQIDNEIEPAVQRLTTQVSSSPLLSLLVNYRQTTTVLISSVQQLLTTIQQHQQQLDRLEQVKIKKFGNEQLIKDWQEQLKKLREKFDALSFKLNEIKKVLSNEKPPNLLEEFKQAIDGAKYENAKKCLEKGLAINSVISLNGSNTNLFEYAAMKQPDDLRFASLVLYFDRLRNNDFNIAPVITISMVEAMGLAIQGEANVLKFVGELQASYEMVMGTVGPLAPLTPIDRLLDVTHALTEEQQKRDTIKSQFQNFYEELYNRPDFKILLELAALATHGIHRHAVSKPGLSLWDRQFKVFVDPNSIYTDSVRFYDNQINITVKQTAGLQIYNLVYLGLQQINTHETISAFIHEITHFIAREIYDNNSNPYTTKDSLEKDFDNIYTHIENSKQDKTEFTAILKKESIYKSTQYHSEIIARTTNYLWNRQDPQAAKTELHNLCPELHDFYFNKFLPNCASHYRMLKGGYMERKQVKIEDNLTKVDAAIAAQNKTVGGGDRTLEIERQFLLVESKQLNRTISAIQNHPDYLNRQQELPVEHEVGLIERLQMAIVLKDEKIERLVEEVRILTERLNNASSSSSNSNNVQTNTISSVTVSERNAHTHTKNPVITSFVQTSKEKTTIILPPESNNTQACVETHQDAILKHLEGKGHYKTSIALKKMIKEKAWDEAWKIMEPIIQANNLPKQIEQGMRK